MVNGLHGTRIHNISNPFFSEIQIKTEICTQSTVYINL